jgi:hypothetical protein
VSQQFDIVKNMADRSGRVPFLLVLQHRFLDASETVVVAPLHANPNLRDVSPRLALNFELNGKIYTCVMTQLAAIPKVALGQTVLNADDRRDHIIRAYDIIVSGV